MTSPATEWVVEEMEPESYGVYLAEFDVGAEKVEAGGAPDGPAGLAR